MVNKRAVVTGLCLGAIIGGLAGCSSDDDGQMDKYEASRMVDDHYYGTKITVTNKQGVQDAEVIEHYSRYGPESILDDRGYIVEWSEMTGEQRVQYKYVLKGRDLDLGGHEMMSESRGDVPGEIRDVAR